MGGAQARWAWLWRVYCLVGAYHTSKEPSSGCQSSSGLLKAPSQYDVATPSLHGVILTQKVFGLAGSRFALRYCFAPPPLNRILEFTSPFFSLERKSSITLHIVKPFEQRSYYVTSAQNDDFRRESIISINIDLLIDIDPITRRSSAGHQIRNNR